MVTVPAEAQQTLLFLAPETGGDFNTLRSTVRARPGSFVRASQDLNQASLDRLRLEKYLDEVKETSDTDPKTLHTARCSGAIAERQGRQPVLRQADRAAGAVPYAKYRFAGAR